MNTDDSTYLDDMVNKMMSDYNSDARQQQVQYRMENISMRDHMRESEVTKDKEGLNPLVNTIHKLTSQCSPDFPSEAHKMRNLINAVASYNRSENPRGQIVPEKYSFNMFITALH